MKTNKFLLFGAVSLWTTVSIFASDPILGKPDPVSTERQAQLLHQFDVNKNGKIDQEERREYVRAVKAERKLAIIAADADQKDIISESRRAELVKMFDANENGKIDAHEHRTFARAIAGERRESQAKKRAADQAKQPAGGEKQSKSLNENAAQK